MTMINGKSGTTRRAVLVSGGAAAIIAAPFVRANAQAQTTLRWWSPQAAPAQREAYMFQIKTFEEANPNIKVAFEASSDEGYPAQMAAAFASGQVPNVVTHLPSFSVSNYWQNNLLEPFNDVINMIGPQHYFDGANRIYEITPGQFAGTGMGGSAANMMWLRKDLMQEAGISAAPRTWDQLRDAAKKMQKGTVFGAPLPYARNSMTSLIFICFVHGAGGQIFTPDLQVAVESDQFRNALEFYKAMREFCPPGATNYSWGDSLTAFVSGATATGIYTGRVLANVTQQNPRIADSVTCAPYPTAAANIPHWTFNDFPSGLHSEGGQGYGGDQESSPRISSRPEGYIKPAARGAWTRAAGAQDRSPTMPKYYDNPIINEVPEAEVKLMAAAIRPPAFNLGFETDQPQAQRQGGRRSSTAALSWPRLVQRVRASTTRTPRRPPSFPRRPRSASTAIMPRA